MCVMRRASFIVVAAALSVWAGEACASRRSTAAPLHPNRELLTQEELSKHEFITVFDAIEALRPHWLRERGPDSFTKPSHVQAYLDGSRLDGVESLRSLTLTNVVYIRHLDANEATARWGPDHGSGAIVVSTHP